MIDFLVTHAVVVARGMPRTARLLAKSASLFEPGPARSKMIEQVEAITASPYAEAFASEAEAGGKILRHTFPSAVGPFDLDVHILTETRFCGSPSCTLCDCRMHEGEILDEIDGREAKDVEKRLRVDAIYWRDALDRPA